MNGLTSFAYRLSIENFTNAADSANDRTLKEPDQSDADKASVSRC
jgi:hypothetical protein